MKLLEFLFGLLIVGAVIIAMHLMMGCASHGDRAFYGDQDDIAIRYSAGVLSQLDGPPFTDTEMELHGLIEQYLVDHKDTGIPVDPAARYDHFIEWLNSTHRY